MKNYSFGVKQQSLTIYQTQKLIHVHLLLWTCFGTGWPSELLSLEVLGLCESEPTKLNVSIIYITSTVILKPRKAIKGLFLCFSLCIHVSVMLDHFSCSFILIYNQCLFPLMWVRIPLMTRCTRYSIMW